MPDLINTQQNKGFGLATGGGGGGVTPQQQAIQQTGLSPVDPPAIEGELLERAAAPAPEERGAFAQGALNVAEGIGDGLIFTGKILAAGVLGTIGGADFSDEILRVGEFSPAKVKRRKRIEEAQIRGAELQNMGRGVDLTIKHITLMKNMRLEDRGPYIESLGDSLTVNGFDHRVALKSAVETGKLEEYEDTLRYLAAKPGITSEMLDLLKTDSSRQNPELLIEFKKNILDAEVKNVAAVELAEKKADIEVKTAKKKQSELQLGILELERKKDAQKAKTSKPLSEAFKRKDIESHAARKAIEGMTRQDISEASEPTIGRSGRVNPKHVQNLEELITKATRATADDKGSEAFEALYRRLVGREFIGDPTAKIQQSQETPPDETGVTNKSLFDKIMGTLGLSVSEETAEPEKPKGNILKGDALQTKIDVLITKFKKQGVTDDAELKRLVRAELNK